MSAARRKGKWVGGYPVLGYDVDPAGGRLLINESEAERVREIFTLFEQYQSTILTLTEIDGRGWTLKSWMPKSGKFRTGSPFDQNSLGTVDERTLYWRGLP
jgi:site-specific DNA recombinase